MATVRAGADGRRRQARGDARRQQIIDEAIKLFAEKGYRGSGLSELADRLGMTHPGMLYYFGTKERLLLEVVAERERIEQAEMADAFGDASHPRSTLETLAEAARFNARSVALTRLYVVLGAENLDPGDPLHQFFVERYATARRLTAESVRRGQRDGTFRTDLDGDQLATEVIATLMGLEIQWLADPEAVDLEASVRAYVEGLHQRLALTSPAAGATPGPTTDRPTTSHTTTTAPAH